MNVFIDIYGIKAKISTQNDGLAEMIKKYYELFLVESIDSCDLEIDLFRYGYFSKKEFIKISKKYSTFGDGVKIDTKNHKYYFNQQEMSGLIDFSEENNIKVTGKLIPNKLRHLIHIALQGITRIDKYYNRFLIKTCVHDIIFILLEKKHNTCILHATAVSNGKETFLFTGLGGSGKSTLASAFSQFKGYTILSDNYAIVSGNRLYPFPELPRITKGTQGLLGINLNIKADGIKNYLENDLSRAKQEYKIDKIFICSYGKDFKLEKIEDKNYLFEILISINNYTKEFPEYLNLALLSVIGKFNTNYQRIESLKNIIDTNKFCLIQNTSDLEDNLNKISDV